MRQRNTGAERDPNRDAQSHRKALERHILDQEERPGAELLDQALDGLPDVLDDVGEMARRAELRSEGSCDTVSRI